MVESRPGGRISSEIEEVSNQRPIRPPDSPVVTTGLPAHLLRDLAEAFKMFDLNGDGKITRVELGTVLRSLGENMTDAELDQMIRDVDADGDGEIDLQEFIDLNSDSVDIQRIARGVEDSLPEPVPASSSPNSSVTDALQSAFNVFDSDKDGFISAAELHRVLSNLGDDHVSLEDCRYMISCVDVDGDELVSFNEFQCLMTGSRAP